LVLNGCEGTVKISFLIILSCALAFLDFYFMSSATKGYGIAKTLCRAVSVLFSCRLCRTVSIFKFFTLFSLRVYIATKRFLNSFNR